MIDPLWYRAFFAGPAVDLWLALEPHMATAAEVAFVEQMMQLPPRARILDVPCGGGRHSVALAERGHQVTAIDISSDFLAAARSLAKQRGVTVDWQQADMRELPSSATFDGVLCFGNSFGYLEDGGNAAFLAAVRASLKPGGRLILDTGIAAESLLPAYKAQRQIEAGDIQMEIENEYDVVNGRLGTTYVFRRGSDVDTRRSSQRVYTGRELHELLMQSGFDEVQFFRDTQGRPFEVGAPRLLAVALLRGAEPAH